MKKIFLTSGIVLCMVGGSALAASWNNATSGTQNNGCTEPNLGVYSGATTMDAVWTAKTYDVTYTKCGTGAASTASDYTHENGATYDSNYVIPTTGTAGTGVNNAKSTASGYTFIGWTTDSTPVVTRGGNGSAANNTGTVANEWDGETPWNIDDDLTVYAACQANQYTITYSCTGGEPAGTDSGSVNNQIVTYNASYTLNNGSGCTLNGYTFNGWSCTNNLSGALVNGNPASGTWSLTSDSTCTAQWVANQISPITWNGNNADSTWTAPTGVSGTNSCTYNGSITLPTAPTRLGYTFGGWGVQEPFDLSTLNACIDGIHSAYTNGIEQDAYGFTASDTGKWGVTFSYGKVMGEAVCSGNYSNPDNTTGPYCWCRVTRYVDEDTDTTQLTGTVQPVTNNPWYKYGSYGSYENCESACVSRCENIVKNRPDVRPTIFGSGTACGVGR